MQITENEKKELCRAFYLLEEAVTLETTSKCLIDEMFQDRIKKSLDEEAQGYRDLMADILLKLFNYDDLEPLYDLIYSEENVQEKFRKTVFYKNTAQMYLKNYAEELGVSPEEAYKNLDLK